MYTLYTSVFRDANSAMRSFDLQGIQAWQPFIYYLTQALDSLNARSDVVFRGLKLRDFNGLHPGRSVTQLFLDGELGGRPGEPEDDTAKYHPGNIVLWPSFSSTTRDFTIAMEYGTSDLKGDEVAVILKIHTQTAKPIRDYSYFVYEEELLYRANATFRVTGLWQATSFNLRQGVKLSSAASAFSIPTEHLAQRALSLDEARRARVLVVTMVEQPVDAPVLDAAAHVHDQRRKAQHAETGSTAPPPPPPPAEAEALGPQPPAAADAVVAAAAAAPEPAPPAAAPEPATPAAVPEPATPARRA